MAMARADLAAAAAAAAELADLEQLWQSLDLPGHRVELVGGRIVVSPSPSVAHADVITELIDQLADVKRHGLKRYTNLTVHFPATRDRRIPDLVVAPAEAPQFDQDELLAPGIVLAAEVVSPSSRREDREDRPRAYAAAGIPLYVLIDQYSRPPMVTLFSSPSTDGYTAKQEATAAQLLRLPEPFGIDLDTARLLG